jgi:hypothetical protein
MGRLDLIQVTAWAGLAYCIVLYCTQTSVKSIRGNKGYIQSSGNTITLHNQDKEPSYNRGPVGRAPPKKVFLEWLSRVLSVKMNINDIRSKFGISF